MCGIFAIAGGERDAADTVLQGLRRLEYRGYDSWGVAVLDGSSITVEKNTGKISDASLTLPKSTIGIGHTRWATHGAVTKNNAHPHYATSKHFVLAHNGIVENYPELKLALEKKGAVFTTETDTEVIVKLLETAVEENLTFVEALRKVYLQLEGRNTVVVLTNKGQIVGARNGSPLVVGRGKEAHDSIFFSSDTFSFAPFVKDVCVVDNGQIVNYDNGSLALEDISTATSHTPTFEQLDFVDKRVDKEGYDHFMIKEIFEAPAAAAAIGHLPEQLYVSLADTIKRAPHVYTIGSGTSGAAASQIAYYLRSLAKIHAVDLIGAETTDYQDLFVEDDILIAPSQSGETADVLEVLEIAQKKGVKIASLVNMPGSMMTRMSDHPFLAHAGPEICVMTTKVFISQLAWGYLLAKTVSDTYVEGIEQLQTLETSITEYLTNPENSTHVKKLAHFLSKKEDIYLMGKGQNLAIITEGMIKIIEGSYIHAHAIAAGDLKHFAITLIEPGVPVIVVMSNDSDTNTVLNAISEIKARGAEIVGISPKNQEAFTHHIAVPDLGETSAIQNVLPLQLLAYYMAVERGNNVDKPRNIAKSVTVK